MDVMQIIQYVVNYLAIGRYDFARAMLYEVLKQLPNDEDRVNIYPMSAPSADLVTAIQNLVGACFKSGVSRLTVDLSLPSLDGIMDANPKVHIDMISQLNEEFFDELKLEMREIYDAWNEQSLQDFIDAEEEGRISKSVLNLAQKLYKHELDSLDDLNCDKESEEYKALS